jgi:hypothetical protein
MGSFATIRNLNGEQIDVPLEASGGREAGTVFIDGVPYHIERMAARALQRRYRVDADKEFEPKSDRRGRCVIVAPFSKG